MKCLKISDGIRVHMVCLLTAGAMAVCAMQREAYSYTIRVAVFHNHDCFHELEPRNMNNSCECMYSRNLDDDYRIKAEFYWPGGVVRAVTQAFVVSYFVFAVPAGLLSDLYGGKWVLWLGLVVSALATGAAPPLTMMGPGGLIAARLAAGLAQALVVPSSVVMVVHWAPVQERVTLMSLVTAGEFLGFGLSHVMHLEAWEDHYYVASGVTATFAVLWLCLVPNTTGRVVPVARRSSRMNNRQKLMTRIPWKAILTSPPVLSLLLLHWAACWLINFLVFTQIYFLKVIGLTETLSSHVLAFAESSIGPSTILWGAISDYLVNNNYISRTTNRKAFTFSSNVLTAVLLVLLPVAGCSKLSVIVIFLSLCYSRGLYCCIFRVLPIDLSPRHAGLIMGFMVSTCSTSSIFSWDLFKGIIHSLEVMGQWRVMFLILAALLVLLSLPFLKFGSANQQTWSKRERFIPQDSPSFLQRVTNPRK